MRCSPGTVLAALAAAIAAGVAALPIAGYAGFTLAVALDSDARNGLGLEIADGLVSASIAFAIFAPIVVGLGVGALTLLGVRWWAVRFVAPLALIAVLSLPAALLVGKIAPDPAPIRRVDEPVLARIAPFEGATSRPTVTFNDSPEWESIEWVTRRVDVLPARTSGSAALRHYRGVLREAGWQIEDVLAEGSPNASMRARRDGRRISVWIRPGPAPSAELDLR